MAELAWRTVQDGVPVDQRVEYMDVLRGTMWGQHLALVLHLQDVMHHLGQTRLGRLVRWLAGRGQ